MTDNDPFLGTWHLMPEKSDYAQGLPPTSGTYTIEIQGTGYLVKMRWQTANGDWMEMQYSAVPDGQDHAYEDPNIADTVSMTRIDHNTLDSDAKKGGQVVAYARRILSEDLQTMTVIQSGPLAEGGMFENLSVYNRT